MPAPALANIVQTLVYYDGPQILLLQSPRNLRMIGAAVEDIVSMQIPFFACTVVERDFRKYMLGKADLHYVYRASHNFYFFDLAKEQNHRVPIRRATEDEIADEKYYPDPGFFSRSHSEAVEGFDPVYRDSYTYRIDGNWDASEFSKFYSNIEDVYSLLVALTKRSAGVMADKAIEVGKFIEERLWRGGGSYVGFYDDLFEYVRGLYPLRMGKLRYASPGEIEVRGDGEAFSDIDALMAAFDANENEMAHLYGTINSILSKEHLRRAGPDAEFSGKGLEDFVQKQALSLAAKMGIDGSEILKLCKGRTLVFAKLVLSFYRRAKILHGFHAEGRIRDRREMLIKSQ